MSGEAPPRPTLPEPVRIALDEFSGRFRLDVHLWATQNGGGRVQVYPEERAAGARSPQHSRRSDGYSPEWTPDGARGPHARWCARGIWERRRSGRIGASFGVGPDVRLRRRN